MRAKAFRVKRFTTPLLAFLAGLVTGVLSTVVGELALDRIRGRTALRHELRAAYVSLQLATRQCQPLFEKIRHDTLPVDTTRFSIPLLWALVEALKEAPESLPELTSVALELADTDPRLASSLLRLDDDLRVVHGTRVPGEVAFERVNPGGHLAAGFPWRPDTVHFRNTTSVSLRHERLLVRGPDQTPVMSILDPDQVVQHQPRGVDLARDDIGP